MKLTDKQKKQLRKEVEQEKRPRVLKFETEINKKKNENKTIEEIMQMVKESETAARKFIKDPEARFQQRLAQIKTQKLDKIRIDFINTHNKYFTLKTFKRFNGIIGDFDELTSFLNEFATLVNINDNTVNKNYKIWEAVKKDVNITEWRKACKTVRKEIPNITLKQFMLQNKQLTVAQANVQYKELMAPAPELTFYDFVMGQIENTLTRITDNPKELIKLIAQTKLKRDITQEKYSIKKDIDQIAEFGNMLFNALIKN
jgi:hypothetical protein